jgi:hypothetical protein
MRFRKKPVVIEAVQYKAGEASGELAADVIAGTVRYVEDGTVLIQTLEGVMIARPGDWIIRGVKGELYPCKPDVFDATYEPAPPAKEEQWICPCNYMNIGPVCTHCGRPKKPAPPAEKP